MNQLFLQSSELALNNITVNYLHYALLLWKEKFIANFQIKPY